MNRKSYFFLFVFTIFLGLSSRKFAIIFPEFINLYLGDALWALMVYWLVRFIKPSLKIINTSFIALIFSYSIEVSQLYHANWIDVIRKTTLGGLILGFGFLWSDMLAYSIGILIGVLLDNTFRHFEKETD
jgi:hypothetical protein